MDVRLFANNIKYDIFSFEVFNVQFGRETSVLVVKITHFNIMAQEKKSI